MQNRNCLVFLFDIDGTLIDSGGAGGGALQIALQHEFDLPETKPVPLHGRTDLGIMTELLELHGVAPSPENRQRLCTRYFATLPEVLKSRGGNVLPGVVKMLKHLSDINDCHLGLLTGNMPHSAEIKLAHFGLWDFFSFGIYGDQAAQRPGLCQPALSSVENHVKSRLPGEQMIIVGDTPLDIELAKAMGARSLAVCTGGFDEITLDAAGADHVVDDLSDTQSLLAWCFESMRETT